MELLIVGVLVLGSILKSDTKLISANGTDKTEQRCVCAQPVGNTVKPVILHTLKDEDQIKPMQGNGFNFMSRISRARCLPGVPCFGQSGQISFKAPALQQHYKKKSHNAPKSYARFSCLPGVPCLGPRGQIHPGQFNVGNSNGFASNYISDCSTAMTGTEGAYTLQIQNQNPFKAYCLPDRKTKGRAWTVVLNRNDDNENFDRPLSDYQRGFGDVYGSHFLGLDVLSAITNSKRYELWIHLTDGLKVINSRYDRFAIGNAEEGYILHTLGQQLESKTDFDSFRTHSGMRFSTKDNDYTEAKCPSKHSASWWFYESADYLEKHPCADTYLTSKYENHVLPEYTYHDFDYKGKTKVRTVIMAIREYKKEYF